MSDVVARLRVLRTKVNLVEEHKNLSMHDVSTCDDAAKEITDLRYAVALLESEVEKQCRKKP